METIRYTERRKTTKKPAIIVMLFLIIGGAFVAYAIKFEDNPKMLGLSGEAQASESNRLENVEQTDEGKLQQAMSLNYEIKDKSSMDKSMSNFISDIHLPVMYVDGKEVTEFNNKIQTEYTERFSTMKPQMEKTQSNYSFNVTYTYYENIIGVKKVVSILIKQQIIDTDSQKVTSEKLTTYNLDLASKNILSQDDILLDLLGKNYKDILKSSVYNYIISNDYANESDFRYEMTGLENFYVQDMKLHIVFNTDTDNIIKKDAGILDIEIQQLEGEDK